MTITQADKAKKFRALHKLPATVGARIVAAGPAAFIIPNPWDGGSARILAGLGFEALATTSSGFAFTLGRRDGAATRDEVLSHCRAIAALTDLPVAADLEDCFGDDPKTSALDRNCKAHEVDNLYVVDGSFFPSSGAVNPGLTIMANALRVGDHLIARLG